MDHNLKNYFIRKAAFVLALIMLFQTSLPTILLALTSGPSQPEFANFEPVSTNNMVNEFTGDFTYNMPVLEVPGANGGGYALGLSYHSGVSPEEESSWVGYGWTLNPGAINRSKRGFPDDFSNSDVIYHNKMPDNWTGSISLIAGLEIMSLKSGAQASAGIRYNNYSGWGKTYALGINMVGGINLGYSYDGGNHFFNAEINPAKILSSLLIQPSEKNKIKDREGNQIGRHKCEANFSKYGGISMLNGFSGSHYNIRNYSDHRQGNMNYRFGGFSVSVQLTAIPTLPPLPVGPYGGVTGSLSFQHNDSQEPLKAYGYMYSSKADEEDMMDYQLEKFSQYTKQDKILGIPFSNADNFIISGEGLGGSFRAFSKKPGNFQPNEVSSTTVFLHANIEAEAGLDNGVGGGGGGGADVLKVGTWEDGGSANSDDFKFSNLTQDIIDETEDEPAFLRFSGDLGGSVEYFSDDYFLFAELKDDNCGGVDGCWSANIDPSKVNNMNGVNGGNRAGRSSYIAYHTNKQLKQKVNGKYYYRYENNKEINDFVNQRSCGVDDGIGEITTFNEDGNRYVYGLPVYSRNEKNLSYDVDLQSDNFIAVRNMGNSTSREVGEESPDPYASTYLLTQINTPDYIDRTLDGPTKDDFGGFTKFSYERKYGFPVKNDLNMGNFFKWRGPYNGLNSSRGDESNPDDDMGSFSSGEKEIYYLKSIETKTHIAFFSTSKREDGLEAPENNAAAASLSAKGDKTKPLFKLDKIELFAKDKNGNPGKKVKTIFFDYDYSLCPGVLNNTGDPVFVGGNNINALKGKLTLKKVWYEYENVVNAKISPFKFSYLYPQNINPGESKIEGYPVEYQNLLNIGLGKKENPPYERGSLDCWGNFQANGPDRQNARMTWKNQGPSAWKTGTDVFDPAAWQLKRITLPSGGEIHIQYEEKDYAFVQDRLAMGMVSLKDMPSIDEAAEMKYYLDLDKEWEIGNDNAKKTLLVNLMKKVFIEDGKRIYFKLLYMLEGSINTISSPSCDREYIKGYAAVQDVGMDQNGVWVQFVDKGDFTMPRTVCRDFAETHKLPTGDCQPAHKEMNPNGDFENLDDDQVDDKSEGLFNEFKAFFGTFNPFQALDWCNVMNPSDSYLRVPLPFAKKGGGVRVSSLLMFDSGMETTGDLALYGNKYDYSTENDILGKTSSGVATNEPSSNREENALVEFIPRFEQDWADKVTIGIDKKISEGPVGESLLSHPSIGYSKVTVKNIHTGISNPGMVVSEFFTVKDYPYDKAYPFLKLVDNNTPNGDGADYTEIHEREDILHVPAGVVNYLKDFRWLTQGFRFVINNMHGKLRKTSTFTLPSDPSKSPVISSYSDYEYFEPGEKVPVLKDITQPPVLENPGKETELVFYKQKVLDDYDDLSAQFDVAVGTIGYPPLVIVIPTLMVVPYNSTALHHLRTHLTTKIINYPAIQKRVTSFSHGITSTTENAAFDQYTGLPLITQTYDGFNDHDLKLSQDHNGKYLSLTIPATQYYSNMRQKSFNERWVGKDFAKTSKNGKLYLTVVGKDICSGLEKLLPGDLVALKENGLEGIYHLGDKSYLGIELIPSSYNPNPNMNPGVVNVEVIRSGNTNELKTSIGKIVTYSKNSVLVNPPSNANQAEMNKRKEISDKLNDWIKSANSYDYSSIFNYSDLLTCAYPGLSVPYLQMEKMPGTPFGYEVQLWHGQPNILEIRPFCSWQVFTPEHGNEKFDIDEEGKLIFFSNNNSCFPQEIQCPVFCPLNILPSTINGVIAATAQTLSDKWTYDPVVFDAFNNSDPFETGERGMWRVSSNFAYKEDIISGNDEILSGNQLVEGRIYKNAGVFKNDYELFNWKNESANNPQKWLSLSTVLKYSTNGEPIEERDILGMYSTAKYGYNLKLPTLVAKNASYSEVQFESFENVYGKDLDNNNVDETFFLEDGLLISSIQVPNLVNSQHHSGKASLQLKYGNISSTFPLKTITVPFEKSLVKVWVKELGNNGSLVSEGNPHPKLTFNIDQNNSIPFIKVAQTGDWSLYEAKMSSNFFLSFTPFIKFDGTLNESVFIDDVRIQPLSSSMNAYVYDPSNFRLVASFDDQHFGMYYQYNEEGQLTRKLIETSKGVKVITEEQMNMRAVDRN